jgi:hypothetical protein
LKRLLDLGRRNHRAITAAHFAPWLDPQPAAARESTLDVLVLATDVYAWKLLRRDMGHSREATQARMRQTVAAILAQAEPLPPTGSRR